MDIYLVPLMDAQAENEMATLADRSVTVLTLNMHSAHSVRTVVRRISSADCHALVVPDHCDRHTPLIEDVKLCARTMGLSVMPLGCYLRKQTTPATGTAVPTSQQIPVVG